VLAQDAATVPQGKDATRVGPQVGSAQNGGAQHGSAQHGRRTSPPQPQRRDTAYDRLPLPERSGIEDGRKRPEGGSGRFRAIEPPTADEVARRRGAPICDYPGASRTKRQSQRRGASP
jgi:hypothetical protein